MLSKKISFLFIIIAGEAIFMLPFMIPRLYRPLMLEAWGFTNTQIGTAFSVYGFSAMVSYFLGGQFADRFHPRTLISTSLLATAGIGIYLILSPSYYALIGTYFFFGISNILLLWGALIKVTHIAGEESARSSAMGILDAGRGLSAALISSLLVLIVSKFHPELNTLISKASAINTIYLVVITFTVLISIAIWVSLKNFNVDNTLSNNWSLKDAKTILRNPSVWLMGIVILSSYSGYKSIDNYSVYLVDVQGQSLIESSFFTSLVFWLRPISAFCAGIFADRLHQKFKPGRFTFITGMLLISGLLQFTLASQVLPVFNLIFLTIIISAAFAYALRAIYFSIFGDLNINDRLIGTTVGVVSLVGFMPDFFFGIITGYLIDNYPGALGYTYSFYFSGILLLIGTVASILLQRREIQ